MFLDALSFDPSKESLSTAAFGKRSGPETSSSNRCPTKTPPKKGANSKKEGNPSSSKYHFFRGFCKSWGEYHFFVLLNEDSSHCVDTTSLITLLLGDCTIALPHPFLP